MTSAEVFQRVIDVWNSGQVGELDQLLHPDYAAKLLHLDRPTRDRDRAAYGAWIERYRATNGPVQFRVLEQFGDEHRLCSEVLGEREIDGGWERSYAVNISRYADGLLIEERVVWSPWHRESATDEG